jgi:hypothetical protein
MAAAYHIFSLTIKNVSESKYEAIVDGAPGLPRSLLQEQKPRHEFVLHFEQQINHLNSIYSRFVDVVQREKRGQNQAETRTGKKNKTLSVECLEFGGFLFQSVFDGEVKKTWKTALETIPFGESLLISLNLEAQELEQLPWEFLRDPDQKNHAKSGFCMKLTTPVVRSAGMPHKRVNPISPPLHIVLIASLPFYETKINLQEEIDLVREQLRDLEEKGMVRITEVKGEDTVNQLLDLTQDDIHILHFLGHGAEGGLLVEGKHGDARELVDTSLADIVGLIPSLQLVILNTCLSSVPAENIGRDSLALSVAKAGVPAVIGMQFEISDHASHHLSRNLYNSIVREKGILEALTRARVSIRASLSSRRMENIEWGTPVLYLPGDDIGFWGEQEVIREDDKEIVQDKFVLVSDEEGPVILADFFNRQSELEKAFKPQNVMLLGPSAYGKTYLLNKVVNHYHTKGYYNLNINFKENSEACQDPFALAGKIARKLGVPVNTIESLDKLSDIEEQITKALAQAGKPILVSFDDIDLVKRTVLQWIRNYWLIQLRKLQHVVKTKVILTGCYKPRGLTQRNCWDVVLTPFNDHPISQMLRTKWVGVLKKDEQDLDAIRNWEESIVEGLTHLSAGHPKCIHNLLDDLAEKSFAVEKKYIENNKPRLFTRCIKPIINELLFDLPEEIAVNFKKLCIVRCFNQNVVNYFIETGLLKSDNPVLFDKIASFPRLVTSPGQATINAPVYTIQPIVRRMVLLETEVSNTHEYLRLHEEAFNFFRSQINLNLDSTPVDIDIRLIYIREAVYHKSHLISNTEIDVSEIVELLKGEILPALESSTDNHLIDRSAQLLNLISHDEDLEILLDVKIEEICKVIEDFIEQQRHSLNNSD